MAKPEREGVAARPLDWRVGVLRGRRVAGDVHASEVVEGPEPLHTQRERVCVCMCKEPGSLRPYAGGAVLRSWDARGP